MLNYSFRKIYNSLYISLICCLSVSISATADEGDIAADFSLPHLISNKTYRLSDYKNSVVLIDFWASWCGPCRASFPAYEAIRTKLQNEYGEATFEVLAINVDMEKKEALSFLKEQKVSFPVLDENTGGETQHKYQILAMPTAFLVDGQGRIIMQHSGFNSTYADLIESTASKLIKSLPGNK